MRAPRPASGFRPQVLGTAFGLAVLIGNTIGMGILRTPGEVAAHLPSKPWFMGVWIAGAVYSLLGALSLAELAALRPQSGGLAPLVYDELGPYAGFVTGWTDWLTVCGTMAAVAMVLSEYLPVIVPAVSGQETLTSIALVAAVCLLHLGGLRASSLVQQSASMLKALGLVSLAIVALLAPAPAPALGPPPATTVLPDLMPSGAVIAALQSAIYTYDGWTSPLYFGGEMRHPARSIPRTMISGVLFVLMIYLLLNAAFLHVLPIAEMAGDRFVAATVAERLFGTTGSTVLRLVVIISLLATLSALALIASRIPVFLGSHSWMPGALGRLHARGAPSSALIASALIAAAFIATNSFSTVLSLLALLMVSVHATCFVALFVSRWRHPHAIRPFRVPCYPLIPAVALGGAASFAGGILITNGTTSLRAGLLLAVSWPVFALHRRFCQPARL
jgi:APA family basic amino acid/polyamine antiporter